MKNFKDRLFFTVCFSLFFVQNAWSFSRDMAIMDVVDWLWGFSLVLFALFIFFRIKFDTSRRFWISLGLVFFNALVGIGAWVRIFYVNKTTPDIGDDVLAYMWLTSIPLSIFIISLLSKYPKKMVWRLIYLIVFFASIKSAEFFFLGNNH